MERSLHSLQKSSAFLRRIFFVLLVIGDILKLTTLRINLEKVVVLQILSTCIPLISNLGLCSLLPFKRLKLLFAQK